MRALVVLVSSLLIGIVGIAWYGGTVKPDLLKVADKVVCDGTFQIEDTGRVYCVNADAARAQDGVSSMLPDGLSKGFDNFTDNVMSDNGYRVDVTKKAVLTAGLIYSAGVFVVLALVALAMPRRR